ncbi:DUF2884 domain-containing protein [Erwinia aphidicola]|jgi:hypothetical protein|uniref:DUF2884 domain-containing protein n=1 Tax=Erwinia aphidicola TaxID=68334 RepID=A0ABU8DE10_ERWAP|nr:MULTISPECIES: DUF2884 domain-containing protein [Erwinia]KMV68987.1 hypothetical protein AI28_23315 [bacteria symbiont BFo1 of Frankliniella occidentalis]PIJ58047.1 hypothetical protein BOM23_11630 [Erwinia sp. OLMDLW33]KYP83501.1 hypothetical protein WB66_17810 [bacteria symbiont BFo1 of Frankliniella occidentalis]KYP88713.1 hypothetical protein WB91_16640 [bacteria symbiont BFo1 of Frankliniella occidentalis]MBD1376346.1 DUF2884 domain-containing protein [Erwinia aphidicola]
MRKALFSGALLLLAAGQAQADYQCSVNPQDDIIISPNQVEVVGASGKLAISPVGDVQRNGKVVDVDAATRQKAIDYQGALRRDLPWIDSGAQQRLEKGRVALDRVVVQKLGENSKVRQRLTTLDGQLKQQMNRIIEHRSDGLTFHHQAVNQVRQDGEQLVQNALGGVVQDSLNEMGSKQTSGDNPLQAIMGNLGGLQQAIQAEWSNQEQDFQNFGHEVCNRVTALEGQRKALIAGLK